MLIVCVICTAMRFIHSVHGKPHNVYIVYTCIYIYTVCIVCLSAYNEVKYNIPSVYYSTQRREIYLS